MCSIGNLVLGGRLGGASAASPGTAYSAGDRPDSRRQLGAEKTIGAVRGVCPRSPSEARADEE